MRVLIVSAVFPPEPVVSAQTSSQVAEGLTHANHSVTVVTSFPSRPAGKLFNGFSRRFMKREWTSSGIEVLRCFATISSESRMFSRLLENLSFGLTSSWQVLTMQKPDVIYSNTWPILATGILFLTAKLRCIPLVISVQDVYPEVLETQQRVSGDGLFTRVLARIDGVIARNSAHVIVISERFAKIYRKRRGVSPDRISLVPNWIESNQIDISISREQFRQRKGIDGRGFLLVYGGNVSVAAGVEVLIDALHMLARELGISLLIAGSGSQLTNCQNLAQAIPGYPVVFHSPWTIEETSEVLRSADLLVLPTQGEQSLASMPSKILSYMLAGRPVLATAIPGSDLAELVKRADCGWVVEPDRSDLLAAQIKEIMKLDPAERYRRGDNGRDYVMHHFTKDACLPKVMKILEETSG